MQSFDASPAKNLQQAPDTHEDLRNAESTAVPALARRLATGYKRLKLFSFVAAHSLTVSASRLVFLSLALTSLLNPLGSSISSLAVRGRKSGRETGFGFVSSSSPLDSRLCLLWLADASWLLAAVQYPFLRCFFYRRAPSRDSSSLCALRALAG